MLVLSDLYAQALRPDVVARAEELGFLIGPYDSYHSVHSPDARPDDTWETAQFDARAYDHGRVINADGSGHAGFLGRGFHFAPEAAWPYVQSRVGGIMDHVRYSAWFVDCDATGECFDDFSERHPSNRFEDTRLRRERLAWLEAEHGLVVGSEGGSVLFSDVIHFGHGVHTPYIGHLHAGFRDRESPYFLGRHWPPDTPEQSFKPVPLPAELHSPYFDPAVRVPLYRAAVGDELVTTHHWSFDSLKFENLSITRELLEDPLPRPADIPPQPGELATAEGSHPPAPRVLGPLHRELATATLTGFSTSENRVVQRTTFRCRGGEAVITVNFGEIVLDGIPPQSAVVSGDIDVDQKVYSAAQP